MANKGGIIGGIITLVIGGTVFSISQADVAKNFSKDTGMSQQQAEQYVENISEDDLVSYEEVGLSYISSGQNTLDAASKIDCVNYSYEWETTSLSCEQAKSQLKTSGNNEIALGKAYKVLDTDSASIEDITTVIKLIDKANKDLGLEIINQIYTPSEISEMKKGNSYNKALLQTALDSTVKK